jgi:hypothetical protein
VQLWIISSWFKLHLCGIEIDIFFVLCGQIFAKVGWKEQYNLASIGILMKDYIAHPMVLSVFSASFGIKNASMTKNFALAIAQGVNWLVPA